MKSIKDTTIRRSNIPNDKVIYQVISRFRYKFLVLFLIFVLIVVLKLAIYWFLVLIVAYVIMSKKDYVVFEVRENFLINMLNDDFVQIIYFDDVINYQIKANSSIELLVYTKDETEYIFILEDFEIIKVLDDVIGEKRVGK